MSDEGKLLEKSQLWNDGKKKYCGRDGMMSRTHTGSGNELMVLLVNGKIKKGGHRT